MTRPLTVLLAAEEAAGLKLLRALAGTPHRLVGVLAAPEGPVWTAARASGLRTWPADRVTRPAFADVVVQEGVDLLLNLHSLHLVCPAVLGAARLGAFNLHPGPLPEYAGLDTPSWALFHGEGRYGVTLHAMADRVDAGGIVERADFAIEPEDTALRLYTKCVQHGLPMVLRLVDTLAADPVGLTLTAMDLSRRRLFRRRVPDDGWVSWERTAAEVVNFVRACDYHPFPSPWGQPKAVLDGVEIGLAKARRTGDPAGAPPGAVVAVDAAGARVACVDETILVTHVAVDGRTVRADGVLARGSRLNGRPTPPPEVTA